MKKYCFLLLLSMTACAHDDNYRRETYRTTPPATVYTAPRPVVYNPAPQPVVVQQPPVYVTPNPRGYERHERHEHRERHEHHDYRPSQPAYNPPVRPVPVYVAPTAPVYSAPSHRAPVYTQPAARPVYPTARHAPHREGYKHH